MHAGATAAGGIGGAEARDGRCHQNSCEKVFHAFFPSLRAAPRGTGKYFEAS
jgi:hypothetical protein